MFVSAGQLWDGRCRRGPRSHRRTDLTCCWAPSCCRTMRAASGHTATEGQHSVPFSEPDLSGPLSWLADGDPTASVPSQATHPPLNNIGCHGTPAVLAWPVHVLVHPTDLTRSKCYAMGPPPFLSSMMGAGHTGMSVGQTCLHAACSMTAMRSMAGHMQHHGIHQAIEWTNKPSHRRMRKVPKRGAGA